MPDSQVLREQRKTHRVFKFTICAAHLSTNFGTRKTHLTCRAKTPPQEHRTKYFDPLCKQRTSTFIVYLSLIEVEISTNFTSGQAYLSSSTKPVAQIDTASDFCFLREQCIAIDLSFFYVFRILLRERQRTSIAFE
ncbi:hypothetical protein [Shimia sp.]|uniref:hypothetical protein n=1 Tax=Shimia sp. TaxID=1954381 RepID=UPI003BAA78FA